MPTVLLLVLLSLLGPLFDSSAFLGWLPSLRVCLVTSAWKSFTLIRASHAPSISSSLHHCHLMRGFSDLTYNTVFPAFCIFLILLFSIALLNGSFMYFSVFSLDLIYLFLWESAFLSSLSCESRSMLDMQWIFIKMNWIIKDICNYKYQKSCIVTFKIILFWVYSAYLKSY